jgi:TonB-linked SusC/RagA family outer membrane protein
MNVKLLSILILYVLFAHQKIFAQTTVSGTVRDQTNQQVLPGATVKVVGATLNVTTGSDGKYTITVPSATSKLEFIYVGFRPQQLDVNGQQVLDVQLVPLEEKLSEVVVVGYGTSKVVNLTGSVSVITNKDLAWKQVGQTSMALQGVAPGVTVTQASGRPGADAGTIRIRGIGTLGTAGQAPLVLVDGIEMGLNNVDPNDIENISVLKDASSSAIYGSRAANGVILVTTKRAKSGKIAINYNMYVGTQEAISMPELVSGLDHMLLLNEAKRNMGQAITFPDSYIESYKQGFPSDIYPNTDWQKLTMTGNGMMYNNSVDISGGNETIKVRASLNHLKQNALIPNTGYNRTSLRVNTDIIASEKLGFKVDIRGNDALVYEPGMPSNSIFFFMNGRVPRNQEGVLSNGNWGQGWLGDNSIAGANASGRSDERSYSAIINIQGDWKPIKGMNLNLMFAPEINSGHDKVFRRSYQTYYGNGDLAYLNPATTNSLQQTSSVTKSNNIRALLTYNNKIATNHSYKLLAGFEQLDNYAESFNGRRIDFLLQDYPVLSAGSQINQTANGNGGSEYGLISYFGRVNYDYKEKYLLEANLRYDGSSRFVEGKRFGLFPSFSAGWRISEEPFMKKVMWVDNLKLRGSWGQVGNQNIGNYPFASSVSLTENYIFNEVAAAGAAINALGNSNISWESTTMTNIGIDVAFLKKFTLTAEYYIRDTKDILLTLPIPYSTGLTAPYQNAGKVRNNGWDLSIGHNNRVGEFDYSVRLALSDVKNKIVSLEGTGPYITGRNIRTEGQPIDAIYGFKTAGLFQTREEIAAHATQFGTQVSPGDIKYVDQNGDGVIDPNDRVILGSGIPRYTYSLDLSASYKGFTLGAFIQGVGKANGYMSGEGVWAFYTGSTAYSQHLDRWTPTNPQASYPRLTFSDQNNIQVSDYWMQDASYLRLKNLQLGYSFPAKWLDKTFVKNFRINISGQNLFTVANFLKGFDVETPEGGISRYPIVKVYSVGLNVNF